MSADALNPGHPSLAAAEHWLRALPADFLPGPAESASVSALASGWIALRFPGPGDAIPNNPGQIHWPDDLPAGVVLLRALDRSLSFAAPVPFGFDVHWLREISEGVLRGTTGVRVHSAGTATITGEWKGRWLAAVVRDDSRGEPGVRVVVLRRSGLGSGVEAECGWQIRAQAAHLADPRELAAALLGVHPLDYVRGLFKDLGSRRVQQFVEAAGARLRAFDALREFWQRLGGRAEAGLWELLRDPGLWSRFLAVVRRLAGEDERPEAVIGDLARLAQGSMPDAGRALSFLEELAASGFGAGAEGLKKTALELARLLEQEGVESLLRALPQAAAREFGTLLESGWSAQRLEELFGAAARQDGPSLLDQWAEAAARLAAPAAEALARQWDLRMAAGLSARRSSAAVADASFRFTAEGLALAARVAAGDLSPLFECSPHRLCLRNAILAEAAARRFFIELHLPMLRARRKQRDLSSIATAEARCTDDGRILVEYRAQAAGVLSTDLRAQTALIFSAALSACDGEVRRDHFHLGFTDRRRLDPSVCQAPYRRMLAAYGLQDVALPGEPCAAVLHLRLPGPFAEAWMQTPSPVAAEYLPAMSRAAQAVQQMARHWLPALYLARIEAYARPSAVHPLLAWACSPPCSGPRKKDLSYDFMDPKVVDQVLQSCSAAFRERLEETWKFLMEAGRRQTAAYYEPADARYILANVRRQQRNLVSLLAADAFLVEAVLNTADCAREVDRLVRAAPKSAVTEMARFAREMAETFHRKLRRLYAGDDFLALGPLFFLEATCALAGWMGMPAQVAAVLTLETGEGKTSYANDAAQKLL